MHHVYNRSHEYEVQFWKRTATTSTTNNRHNEVMRIDSNNIIDDEAQTMSLPQVEENDYMTENTPGEMDIDMGYINGDNDLAQDYPRIPRCYEEPISIMKSLPNEN